MDEIEVPYWYPQEWREEFILTGTVGMWHADYPETFDGSRGTHKPFPKNESNLSTYVLMYLLRRDEGLHSLTYFRLAAKSKNEDRERLQQIMRSWMGNDKFEKLRSAIRESQLIKNGFEGEPDLFCWNPANGNWLFAEAKGKDKLIESQPKWFRVCRDALPGVEIRVCKVRPQAKAARQ